MNNNSIKQYLKKNWLSTLIIIGIVVMLISPNAKSWVIRQLMFTGIFNAHIENKVPDKTGEKAVSLAFIEENGQPLNTSSLRGKVVFINFWASWCPPCIAEMPSIQELYEHFDDNPAISFLMVNEGESPARAQSFLEKEGFSWPIFRISGNIPEDIYKGVLPTTVVLDKAGKVRYHHKGFANYSSKKFVSQMRELINE